MRFNPIQKTYVIATTGALGDTCATLPTLKILAGRGHLEKLFVDDRYLDLYRLFFPAEILVRLAEASVFIPKEDITPDIPASHIDPLTGGATLFNYPVNPNYSLVKSLRSWPSSVHMPLVDNFSIAICDAILRGAQRDYPRADPAKLPTNPLSGMGYVVIAYGATTEHRRMLPEVLAGLVDHFNSKGIEVVLLGRRDHLLVCSNTITSPTFDAIPPGVVDLIDQTTLLEALAIMQDARMVIGLDNGLLHLAALTDVPIVGGYTTVDPFYRVPQRHGVQGWNFTVIEPDSECRYCQTETFCTYRLPFLKCQIATKECMYSLTLDKWISGMASNPGCHFLTGGRHGCEEIIGQEHDHRKD